MSEREPESQIGDPGEPPSVTAPAGAEQPSSGVFPAANRPGTSQAVHWIDRFASRPSLAVVVVAANACWVAISIAVDFSTRLETIFQTLVAALTLSMVFVIQHTQSRQQRVTQRKLDEILSAIPKASNALIAFEDAPDDELDSVHRLHRRLRHDAADEPLARDGGEDGRSSASPT